MTNIFLLRLFVFQNVQQKRQKPEQITSKMTDHSDNEHKHIPGHTSSTRRDRRGLQWILELLIVPIAHVVSVAVVSVDVVSVTIVSVPSVFVVSVAFSSVIVVFSLQKSF